MTRADVLGPSCRFATAVGGGDKVARLGRRRWRGLAPTRSGHGPAARWPPGQAGRGWAVVRLLCPSSLLHCRPAAPSSGRLIVGGPQAQHRMRTMSASARRLPTTAPGWREVSTRCIVGDRTGRPPITFRPPRESGSRYHLGERPHAPFGAAARTFRASRPTTGKNRRCADFGQRIAREPRCQMFPVPRRRHPITLPCWSSRPARSSTGPVRSSAGCPDLYVRDGWIADIGPSGDVPSEARMLDFSDHAVVPGLIDCHVHLAFSAGVDPRRPAGRGRRRAVPARRSQCPDGAGGRHHDCPRPGRPQRGRAGAQRWDRRGIATGPRIVTAVRRSRSPAAIATSSGWRPTRGATSGGSPASRSRTASTA